jgi:hypothetical protein
MAIRPDQLTNDEIIALLRQLLTRQPSADLTNSRSFPRDMAASARVFTPADQG